jgi:hypothetical protein
MSKKSVRGRSRRGEYGAAPEGYGGGRRRFAPKSNTKAGASKEPPPLASSPGSRPIATASGPHSSRSLEVLSPSTRRHCRVCRARAPSTRPRVDHATCLRPTELAAALQANYVRTVEVRLGNQVTKTTRAGLQPHHRNLLSSRPEGSTTPRACRTVGGSCSPIAATPCPDPGAALSVLLVADAILSVPFSPCDPPGIRTVRGLQNAGSPDRCRRQRRPPVLRTPPDSACARIGA